MRKYFFLAAIIYSLMISVSMAPASEQWDRQDGANNVAEYANDSGSFALLDGCEFTAIRADASVTNGSGSIYMTAVAHIEVSTNDDAHAAVYSNGRESTTSGSIDLTGDGISGCDWYWTIDARNNNGNGSAWCKWRWDCE